MKNIKTKLQNFWKDESGQGTAEYVMLIMIVVAIVFIFKDKIKTAISGKMDQAAGQINGFSGE
jgi:Flp pilus assembly pilin Flp